MARATQEEILEDVKRILNLTKSDKFPKGDIRISTYLSKDMGLYSRDAIYSAFRHWDEILRRIFPKEKIQSRYSTLRRNTVDESEKRKYIYKKRTCLQCDRSFMSWDAGNRKCKTCLASFQHQGMGDEDTYELVIPKQRASHA
jgi:hypothetical protein